MRLVTRERGEIIMTRLRDGRWEWSTGDQEEEWRHRLQKSIGEDLTTGKVPSADSC